jgi:GntR family transcriptional repressor for pyruvate dehydrogenase complex
MTPLSKPVPIADAISEHLEQMILEGVLRPGERLVAERELADKLGVSRPSLREALEKLEARGLLVTRKTGTYVTQFNARLADPLLELLRDKPRVTADYFEFRRILEAEAARLAALRGTEVDLENVRAAMERMRAARAGGDPAEEAQCDVAFHLALYESGHNVIVLHVMRVLSEMLREGIFYNRDQMFRRRDVGDALLAQHLAIGEAVLARDPAAAQAAAEAHIRYTFDMVEEARRDEMRLATALRRIDRKELVAER